MYIPAINREDDPALLHALIRQYSFAILVTQHEGAPFASHLPFLLDAGRGRHGTLLAHMARANPQWRDFEAGREALVIFQGPHAYISPSWYDPGPNVPTWNYAVVHAYGVPRIVEDHPALYAMLEKLIDMHEDRGLKIEDGGWRKEDGHPDISERPSAFRDLSSAKEGGLKIENSTVDADHKRSSILDPRSSKLGGIVGFEIEIARLEGKFKLSQNRTEGDRRRVIEALSRSDDATIAAVGALMRQREPAIE